MMLATWLVEIFLSKLNQLEDIAASEAASEEAENFKAEKMMLEDDMKQFLKTYRVSLLLSSVSPRELKEDAGHRTTSTREQSSI
jgi:acetylglutamate kinase